ncbi:hypothetical protein [Catellatospora sichuanensis]|uniref:hypothetical protein n=1 Tax=Catellatospora sichuanensis TaxID=1969805 RepID=UPI00118264FE|nr:hypothetical protein [Catellatospora sichuanensis]
MTRSAEAIRQYLHGQVNQALRRPGMYGGEATLYVLLDALAYADGVDAELHREREDLRARWMSLPTGVLGAVEQVFPEHPRPDTAMTSVYAEFAHRVGWLDIDRLLSAAEHGELLARLPGWCTADRTMSDVTAAFGVPSVVFGGTNPHWPKTLIYAAGPGQPLVCLHLWNEITGPELQTAYPEPTLLAARIGGRPFDTAFILTPEGRHRRPGEPDSEATAEARA